MVAFLFKLVKKIVMAALLIYSFDVFAVSLGFSIPINLITVFIVSVFDFFGVACLFLFLLTF